MAATRTEGNIHQKFARTKKDPTKEVKTNFLSKSFLEMIRSKRKYDAITPIRMAI